MKYRVLNESLGTKSGWFHTLGRAVDRARDTPILSEEKFIEDEAGEIVALVVDDLIYQPLSRAEIDEIDRQSHS